jgi:methionyl-tRNA formyltransferase
MLRARLFQSEAAGWRRRYFVRDARRTDRLLKREMRRSSAATLPTTTHRVATVNDHAESIRALQPDVLLIYGGGIVSARILQAARVALNVHAGKLPEYRGVHSALFALAQGRPDHVGVTVHVAEASLDSGPIAAWRPFPVDRVSSMPELRCHLCREGMSAAIEVIREIGESGVDPDAQTGGARPRRAKDITAETIRGAYRAIRSTRCGPEQASSARPVTVWTG